MRKFVWFILCVLFIVDIAWFAGMRYDALHPKPPLSLIQVSKDFKPGAAYGKFHSQYEQYFTATDRAYKEVDNLLNAAWIDSKMTFEEKAQLLSMRDRLEMITVLLNYVWFDEYTLAQGTSYFQPQSMKVFIDSNYAHKVRILSEVVENQLENTKRALSLSKHGDITAALRNVNTALKNVQDFLTGVKTDYKISD